MKYFVEVEAGSCICYGKGINDSRSFSLFIYKIVFYFLNTDDATCCEGLQQSTFIFSRSRQPRWSANFRRRRGSNGMRERATETSRLMIITYQQGLGGQ